jgi:hypothetical protein
MRAFFWVSVGSILLAVLLLLAGYEPGPRGEPCSNDPDGQTRCEERGE